MVGDSKDGGIGEFAVDSPETEAADFVAENYGGENRVIAQIVVRDEGGDVLTLASLLDGLRLQQEVRENASLNATLTEDGFVGVENVVGLTPVFEDAAEEPGPLPEDPFLADKIEALEKRDEAEVEAMLGLGPANLSESVIFLGLVRSNTLLLGFSGLTHWKGTRPGHPRLTAME